MQTTDLGAMQPQKETALSFTCIPCNSECKMAPQLSHLCLLTFQYLQTKACCRLCPALQHNTLLLKRSTQISYLYQNPG